MTMKNVALNVWMNHPRYSPVAAQQNPRNGSLCHWWMNSNMSRGRFRKYASGILPRRYWNHPGPCFRNGSVRVWNSLFSKKSTTVDCPCWMSCYSSLVLRGSDMSYNYAVIGPIIRLLSIVPPVRTAPAQLPLLYCHYAGPIWRISSRIIPYRPMYMPKWETIKPWWVHCPKGI